MNLHTIKKWIFSIALILSINPSIHADPGVTELNQVYRAFKLAWDAGDDNRSLAIAEHIVDLVDINFGSNSNEMVTPLHNLGSIHKQLGNNSTARRYFKQSINIAETHRGLYSPSINKTLTELGKLYVEIQHYPQALEVLRRAQHIMHRADGVYTLDQLGVLDWITRARLLSNEPKLADRQQRFAFQVTAHNYAPGDVRLIGALHKLGNWFRETGQYSDALATFQSLRETMLLNFEDNDLRLIDPLRAIASIYFLQESCCADELLQQIVDVLAANPGSDVEDEIWAITELADVVLARRHTKRATNLYESAWVLSTQRTINTPVQDIFSQPKRLGIVHKKDLIAAFRDVESGPDRHNKIVYTLADINSQRRSSASISFGGAGKVPRQSLIGNPLPLCYPQVLDLSKDQKLEDLADYYVDLDFTVNETGRVSQVNIVQTNAPGKLGRYVRNLLRKTLYRPRMVDGSTVATRHLKVRQTFSSHHQYASTNTEAIFDFNSNLAFDGCNLLAMNQG
ncbi:MAG: tetratricopeptide repeat protein [Gammaproteobacteria bacterium]|nr:tetratricopeptide repeat protein [Gammaproteobacteria bacterium]